MSIATVKRVQWRESSVKPDVVYLRVICDLDGEEVSVIVSPHAEHFWRLTHEFLGFENSGEIPGTLEYPGRVITVEEDDQVPIYIKARSTGRKFYRVAYSTIERWLTERFRETPKPLGMTDLDGLRDELQDVESDLRHIQERVGRIVSNLANEMTMLEWTYLQKAIELLGTAALATEEAGQYLDVEDK